MSENKIFEFIRKTIADNDIVLFMKGTKEFPRCGFSEQVVAILRKLNLQFRDVDVMADSDLREGIKIFSDWPTIPQLYVRQEFVGGCDIVREMYKNGELAELLQTR